MIKVLFFATIRDYTREKETVAEGSGTVGDLLLELSDRYGGEFRDEAFDGDTISDRVIVLVNGRHIARGEVLVLNEAFCVRVSEIIEPFQPLEPPEAGAASTATLRMSVPKGEVA